MPVEIGLTKYLKILKKNFDFFSLNLQSNSEWFFTPFFPHYFGNPSSQCQEWSLRDSSSSIEKTSSVDRVGSGS